MYLKFNNQNFFKFIQTFWFILAMLGPWVKRDITISLFPFQAAKCNGEFPCLSTVRVDAAFRSSRTTIDLKWKKILEGIQTK